jgi:hypothetical protein
LKLPTLRNCPECSDRYSEYRKETVDRRSVHERIGRMHPSDDRRLKINEILITQGKVKLIRDGLIKKKRNTSTSGKKDSGARLA